MDLCISAGSEQIVSYDPDSIAVLAYLYLGRCPIHVDNSLINDAKLTRLPLLKHAGIETSGIKNILTYLRSQNYGLEYDLTDAKNVELVSLVAVIERQLMPALDWFLWGEDDVFVRFTRECYTTRLSRLTAFYLPHKWRANKIRRAKHSQLTHCLRQMSETERMNELYILAKRCLTALSYILGKKTYFVDDRPTAVDAYLFGQLWPLLLYESRHGTADWSVLGHATNYTGQSASHPLIAHLLQCPNLVAHFIRIQNEYFPKAAASFRQDIAANASKRLQSANLFSNHPVRDCLLVGSGVLCLFFLYARHIGMIRIASA
ncbi:hypothetical protein EG68_07500 [Paragonimus skrjabini miyazakii]|uniref:Metaxin n=1 Tax=Paragonimus skrjabini miyazakii TaxID=59628 RepID=A0A8S9Z332_9TREM|nr:hypothetical protein EG68_07500 [Paragonimus skrjabini miyazakii]